MKLILHADKHTCTGVELQVEGVTAQDIVNSIESGDADELIKHLVMRFGIEQVKEWVSDYE